MGGAMQASIEKPGARDDEIVVTVLELMLSHCSRSRNHNVAGVLFVLG